jgi:hypothetical protein
LGSDLVNCGFGAGGDFLKMWSFFCCWVFRLHLFCWISTNQTCTFGISNNQALLGFVIIVLLNINSLGGNVFVCGREQAYWLVCEWNLVMCRTHRTFG